jgi:spore germination protein KB
LEDGVRPVIAAALPEVVSFPFGEMVLFLMYWRFVNKKKKVLPATLISYSMAGLFLVFTNALILSILEPDLAGIGGIPLMIVASLIRITQFVERMDPFVAILLFIGVWIKQTAYYFGAAMALASIFKTTYKRMTLPAGAVIFIGALLFNSFMDQIRFGFEYNVKYHFPIFQIVLPALLLLLMLIRKKGKKNNAVTGQP